MSNVFVVEYKALDPVLGLFGPALTTRINTFAKEHYPEGDPDLLTRQFLARTVAADPFIKILIVASPEGKLVGHCVATLDQHGEKRWIYGWQLEIDGKQEGAVEQVIAHLENWGMETGASNLIMTTHRSERAWQRKYNFESRHAVMTRPIPYVKDVVVSELRE